MLTDDGRYDRRAIMVDAHRQHRLMARHGWSWSRCLKLAWAKARAMRARVHGKGEAARIVVRPTVDGVAALIYALTGQNITPEDMPEIADELASLSN